MTEATLITGGDGYLGSMLAEKILHNTDNRLVLWIRANNNNELDNKLASLDARYSKYGNRVEFKFGNLADDNPLDCIDRTQISDIIHTAAITRFNIEEELANSINRDGSRKVMQFARNCPQLKKFSYISTVYSSGLKRGTVEEDYVDPNIEFCNFYEKSKCEAENYLHTEFTDLPWTVYRPATMIADDASGRVTQYNVFHNTMRLLFYGLISIIPGEKDTPIYLTTGKDTADTIFHIAYLNGNMNVEHQIFNVCHRKHEALKLGDLVDRVFTCFATDHAFTKRRILKPLFTNMKAFNSLASNLKGIAGVVVREALESIRPFSKQLFIEKDIVNANVLKAWPEGTFCEVNTLADNVVDYLIKTSWGNKT